MRIGNQNIKNIFLCCIKPRLLDNVSQSFKHSSILGLVLVICLFIIHPLILHASDWKTGIGPFMKKARQYDKIVQYIEDAMPGIPEHEKPQAVILLSYAYKELSDTVNEEKWISDYFENHDDGDPDLSFLNRKEMVKVFQYIGEWRRRYPRIQRIGVNRNSRQIAYFSPPDKFYIDIEVAAPAGITITGSQNQALYTGYLHTGKNTVDIPLQQIPPSICQHALRMVLKSGSIEIKQNLLLHAKYQYPLHVVFEPVEGKLAIKGNNFKKETSEKLISTTRKYFDKKYFFKKALPNIGIGCAVLVLNSLTAHKKAGNDTVDPGGKAVWNGIDKTATVMSIGISLKGIIATIKSFKKEKKISTQVISHPEATAYNRELANEINQAKAHVFISYKLELQGERHQK